MDRPRNWDHGARPCFTEEQRQAWENSKRRRQYLARQNDKKRTMFADGTYGTVATTMEEEKRWQDERIARDRAMRGEAEQLAFTFEQTQENQRVINQNLHTARIERLRERAAKRSADKEAAQAEEAALRAALAEAAEAERPAIARRIVGIHNQLLAIVLEEAKDTAKLLGVTLKSSVVRGLNRPGFVGGSTA